MWSLGCVLYEMCALQLAFPADNFVNLIQSICRGSYRQPLLPYSQCCGSGMFIPDPIEFSPSRIQGQKDSGSRIRIRIKEFKYFYALNPGLLVGK
jgi:hypothetical protein